MELISDASHHSFQDSIETYVYIDAASLFITHEWILQTSTFDVCWSVFAERQGVRSDHQQCQLAEHQSKNSHDHTFALSLVQEVGWAVRSYKTT